MDGSSIELLKIKISSSYEKLRGHVNDIDLVEIFLLLMLLRWKSGAISSSQNFKAMGYTGSLEILFKITIDAHGDVDFKDYLKAVWQKFNLAVSSDSRGQVIFELWNEFLNYPFFSQGDEDSLGGCFEWFLSFFAEENMGRGGYFFTPSGIVSLIINILNPKSGEAVYDPVCGSGEFFVGAINHVRHASSKGELFVAGREMSPSVAFVAKVNLLIHGMDENAIEQKNSLTADDYGTKISGCFDVAVANPPFSFRKWDSGNSGEFLRYGVPPQANADFAFIQNLLFSLNDKGRAAIIVPMGVLFRAGSEKSIRERMLREHNIDAIISVPSMSFYGTAIPANILFLRKKCASDKVFFIDSSSFFVKSQRLNRLGFDAIEHLSALFLERKEVDGVASCVSFAELEANDWDLTVSKYVSAAASVVSESLETLSERQNNLQQELSALLQEMERLLYDIQK